MDIKEYLQDRNALIYDFSNDGSSKEYCALDGLVYEKFFTYMSISKIYMSAEDNIMKYGADFSQACKEVFGKPVDADSESDLLQTIYRILWKDKYLKECTKDGRIKGDTMHSQNTTLAIVFREILETDFERAERESIRTDKGGQSVSARYIISRYAKDKKNLIKRFDSIKGLKEFIAVYHTLGNFIPFPVNCNGPRGSGNTKDYWDLSLYYIYEYYINNGDNHLKDIVGNAKRNVFRKWLDSYKVLDDGQKSWNNFINDNYLQDFVNITNGECGLPKELWSGHFSESVAPNSKEEIEQFYSNASAQIMARGSRLLIELTKRINCPLTDSNG